MPVLSGATFAQYRKPFLKDHALNPLISALPAHIEPGRFKNLMTVTPRVIELENASNNDRVSVVKRLSNTVVPTKPYLDFYNEIYGMIVSGYEKRNPLVPSSVRWSYDVADPNVTFEELHKRKAISTQGCETTADHLFLTGHSGMGKTKMKNAVLSGCFPSCIIHQRPDFDEAQIVYLSIEMPPNGAQIPLLINIIDAIDETLKGIEDTNYTSTIRRPTVGGLVAQASNLCQQYHVGILFIDEFQNLNVVDQKKYRDTIQLFSSLSNVLSLPVVKIGTHEAINKLLPYFKDRRRAGDLIDIQPYIKSATSSGFEGKDWEALFNAVITYQVVNKKASVSQKLEDRLYYLSCGIPYVLFRLWQKVQIEAILSGKDTINLSLIDAAYNKYFKLIHTALAALRNNRPGKVKDLINVSRLFDDQQPSQALVHLQKMVNKDEFTGVAATELNKAIDDVEFNNALSKKDKSKLANIKKRLSQNSHKPPSGQSIDHDPKGSE